MSWNYRICKKTYNKDKFFNLMSLEETFYELREVYYDDAGNVNGYTENPVTLVADDIKEFAWLIAKITEAYYKDVIDLDVLEAEQKARGK